MAIIPFGWTSKLYDFGDNAFAPAIPSRAFFLCDYELGSEERVVVKATFGKTDGGGAYLYRTLLDTAKDVNGDETVSVDLRGKTIDISDDVPTSEADWHVIVKCEIHTDEYKDDNVPGSILTTFWCLLDQITKDSIVLVGPDPPENYMYGEDDIYVDTSLTPEQISEYIRKFGSVPATPFIPGVPNPVPDMSARYIGIPGVQVQVKYAGTDYVYDMKRTATTGRVQMVLPPGKWEVRFFGGGFDKSDYFLGENALIVGNPDDITKWGDDAGDVASLAEYSRMIENINQISWTRYHIIETFSTPRTEFRDETADPNAIYTSGARHQYGRLFKGDAFLRFWSLSMDPAPETGNANLVLHFNDNNFASAGTFARTGEAYYRASTGTWTAAADGIIRSKHTQPDGNKTARLEGGATNLLWSAFTPATQARSLSSGTHTLSVAGSGSCNATGATDGDYGDATEGSPLTFSVTTGQSVTFTVTGSLDVFQCEATAYPTAFIATASASGSRNADAYSRNFAEFDETLDWTFYVKMVAGHLTNWPSGSKIWSVKSDNGQYLDLYHEVTPDVRFRHYNGTSSVQSDLTSGTWNESDVLEFVCQYFDDGSVRLHYAVNEGAWTSLTQSGTLTPVAFVNPVLWINSYGTSFYGFGDYDTFKAAKTTYTPNQMRAIW